MVSGACPCSPGGLRRANRKFFSRGGGGSAPLRAPSCCRAMLGIGASHQAAAAISFPSSEPPIHAIVEPSRADERDPMCPGATYHWFEMRHRTAPDRLWSARISSGVPSITSPPTTVAHVPQNAASGTVLRHRILPSAWLYATTSPCFVAPDRPAMVTVLPSPDGADGSGPMLSGAERCHWSRRSESDPLAA